MVNEWQARVSVAPLVKFEKVPDFSFINQDGETITNKDYEGKVYIVEFFFTTCPSICPVMNQNMVKIQESVLRLMDRFDESAEEINNWCSNTQINVGSAGVPEYVDNIFHFHNFKVYQLEETRDIIDFGTARTYGGNKIIIDFDYHQQAVLDANGNDSVMRSNWAPEFLASKRQI